MWFSEKFCGTEIPLLEDVLKFARQNNVKIKIDNCYRYFTDKQKENPAKLYDLIWNEFHDLWNENKINQENTIKSLYSIFVKIDGDIDIWNSVNILDDYFCHLKDGDGMVNKEKFNKIFFVFRARYTVLKNKQFPAVFFIPLAV